MSKELEALNYLYDTLRLSVYLGVVESAKIDSAKKCIEQALQRLEAIDNSNPSEALEEIKTLRGFNQVELNNDENVNKSLDTIKQALLKAQEPKKYLTWENLEKDRTYKALLNGNQYELVKRYDDYEYRCDYITLQKKPNVSIYIYEYEKEIFNDLHLERVEE